MAFRVKKYCAVAVSGAALTVGLGLAQPAAATAAADVPPGPIVSFYAGQDLHGREIPVDIARTGCQALPEPARSAVNFSVVDIKVYFNPGCEPGSPGQPSDVYYVLGSLNQGNFPYPAVSYEVVVR
ncbi:hypothetical protein [Streptomyces sp. UNOC14_S4]|uniref:hypothetical protein n=1 Tax=Streptomyces sp. UNOC14_S4 TaxID=2872340 RepID=UPI001E4B726F|nr:hypothetical protein [Streptomyces sp. UNOC14_S4]MCC3770976.1 hypothetical protein [Streptomyces sp. UNOC14_S4]